MKKEDVRGRCDGCKYAKIMGSNPSGWQFVGCIHEPYKGKWTCEIEQCPKQI